MERAGRRSGWGEVLGHIPSGLVSIEHVAGAAGPIAKLKVSSAIRRAYKVGASWIDSARKPAPCCVAERSKDPPMTYGSARPRPFTSLQMRAASRQIANVAEPRNLDAIRGNGPLHNLGVRRLSLGVEGHHCGTRFPMARQLTAIYDGARLGVNRHTEAIDEVMWRGEAIARHFVSTSGARVQSQRRNLQAF